MSGESSELYDTDFFAWTQDQAAALRHLAGIGSNMPLDWENLAEEIDDLGRSVRRELSSRIGVVLEHLLELQHCAATEPRAGWRNTVKRERLAIWRLLDDSPSLRPKLDELISKEMTPAADLAADALAEYGEAGAAQIIRAAGHHYSQDQILRDWWPDASRA